MNNVSPRTFLMIDGSHVDRLRSKLGRPLDIQKLRTFFAHEDLPSPCNYYRDARDIGEAHRLGRFFDWLSNAGIQIRGAQDFSEPWYQRERYGSNLVELAVDAMDAAQAGYELAIVAGDAKLIPLFGRLEDMDVPVTLISSLAVPDSIAPPPPLVELVDEFIDLNADDRFFMPED